MNEQYKHLHFSMDQAEPINKFQINLFRVFASDERAPGRLGALAQNLDKNLIEGYLESDGIIRYESESIAVFNMINACRNVINSKTSIKEDIRMIN